MRQEVLVSPMSRALDSPVGHSAGARRNAGVIMETYEVLISSARCFRVKVSLSARQCKLQSFVKFSLIDGNFEIH